MISEPKHLSGCGSGTSGDRAWLGRCGSAEALPCGYLYLAEMCAGAHQELAKLLSHRSGHRTGAGYLREQVCDSLLPLTLGYQLAIAECGNLTIGVAQSWIHGLSLSRVVA
jgi:hypothetical protein